MNPQHADVHPTIQDRIDRYSPTVLDPEAWQRHGNAIRALVTSTPPRSVDDAKCLLVVVCKYVAWRLSSDMAVNDLPSQLDERSINAYVAHAKDRSPGRSAENELGRLRRISRSARDIPESAPSSSPRRSNGPLPYTEEEIATLVASTEPAVVRAVSLALSDGVVPPSAYEHPNGYEPSAWQRARRAAAISDVALNARRLHMTWATRLAGEPVSAADLVRRGLSVTELDAIAGAAGPLDVTHLAAAR